MFRRFFPFFQQKANPNYIATVASQPLGQPVRMPMNSKAFMNEGYKGNRTVFQITGQLSRAASGINWKLYTDRTKQREIKSHPLLDRWENPNPHQSRADIVENWMAFYVVTGNSYLLGLNATQNPLRPFDEIYNLRPDLTKIEVDENGPSVYEYEVSYPVKKYPAPFVLHNKLFAGNDDIYGLSPIQVAALLVDIQKAGLKWNLALMQNMAAPGGAWVTDQILNDPDYKNLKKEIHEKFSGPKNAREPIILHGGVKWQAMTLTPLELDWLASDDKGARDIAGIMFNFPCFLLNMPGGTTFNNVGEAKYFMYMEIVFPLLDKLVGGLNRWLSPRYGQGLWLDYDREDVETIQERMQSSAKDAADRATSLWTASLATFNESREMQGLKAVQGGDVLFLPGGKLVNISELADYAEQTVNPPSPPALPPPPDPQNIIDADPTQQDDQQQQPQKRLNAPRQRNIKALDLRTSEQKAAYFKSVESLRQGWETKITDRLQDYFKTEHKTVKAALERGNDTDGASDRLEHALQVLEQQGSLKHIITGIWQDVGQDSGNQVAQELKSAYGAYERKDFSVFAPDVLVYLYALAGQKVTQINSTTLEMLQRILHFGAMQGESIPELAKRIDALYLQQIIPNRSTVIARTEVVAASNYGSQEAAKQSGLTLNKVWLATQDSRTRPDHASADGQIVGMNDPFQVGGSQMMYPGDNSMGATADQIIQCRCTQFYKRVNAPALSSSEDGTDNWDGTIPLKNSLYDIDKKAYRALLKAGK